jgi:hypothetical protein
VDWYRLINFVAPLVATLSILIWFIVLGVNIGRIADALEVIAGIKKKDEGKKEDDAEPPTPASE